MRRILPVVCAAFIFAALLSSCGGDDEESELDDAAAVEEQDDFDGAETANPSQGLSDFLEEQARSERAEKERRKEEDALTSLAAMEAKGDERSRQMAAVLRLQLEADRVARDPSATEAQKEAAAEKHMLAQMKMSRRDRNVKQPVLELPPDWAEQHREVRGAKEAELLVQVGDIDNLGFGWPADFDPFSGKSTPVHGFPWRPGENDPPGTDRIMVNSGAPLLASNKDGYTRETFRDENQPEPLVIEFDPASVAVRGAVLQLFVDDFQAPVMKTRFTVTLDGRSAPDVETTINKLNQTGPIGKLVTIKLLPEYLGLLADGKLELFVDDPATKIGDGFAFDFARLLINPKGFTYSGAIRGVVVDAETEQPLAGALVSAANVQKATTAADGRFELKEVPAGLVITTGSHPDYVTGSEQSDLLAGEVLEVMLRLERAKNEDLAERLESEGKVDLYGIYFDTDKATLRGESEATLNQVLALLKTKPELRIEIGGHTDSQASDAYNLDLSKRRAQAVMKWLVDREIAAARLTAEGFGESRPVADNETAAGRALNRRVEIRDLTR
jgi:outer membrane protein OmpA-like peptidoglycan-associated protein